MDNQEVLNPDSLRAFNRWHLIGTILLALLLLLLPWIAGIGPNSWRACCAPVAAAAPVAQPEPSVAAPPVAAPSVAPPAAVAAAPASDMPANARVFFDVSRFDLPADIDATLLPIVAYLKAHPDAKAALSGFHDPRGDKAQNEQLALDRARAVRSALERLGVARDRVVMEKPRETTGTGSLDDARRVEVSVQP